MTRSLSHSKLGLAAMCSIAALSAVATGCAQTVSSQEAEAKSTNSDLYVLDTSIWANASIPVCWETTGNDTEKGWVRNTIETTWEQETAINFSGWGTCNAGTNSGIRIQTADVWPATSKLGNGLNNLANGMQLNFWFNFTQTTNGVTTQPFAGCIAAASREQCIRAIAAHEFGHAMGFSHEQNRGDTPSTCTKPAQGGNGNVTYGSWDLSSIMNYCNPQWNNNGLLSATDIAGASKYYGGPHSIATVSWGSNRLDSFFRGTDGALWHKYWNGSAWIGPESLGGFITSDPTAVTWGGNQIDVYARGGDGAVYHKGLNGTWGAGWEDLQGFIVGAPTAVIADGFHQYVFARGGDNQIYVRSYYGGWSPSWTALGGNITGSISAVSKSAGKVDVFARAADGTIGHVAFDGSKWLAYESLGGALLGSPSAVSAAPGQLDVYAKGMNYGVWHTSNSGGAWSGWSSANGAIYGNPVAISRSPNVIDVFARGQNDALFTTSTLANYSWWTIGGGTFAGSPSVASWAPARLDAFVRGTNQHELHTYWAGGTTWSSFEDVGGNLK
jgi:hypothetical protein